MFDTSGGESPGPPGFPEDPYNTVPAEMIADMLPADPVLRKLAEEVVYMRIKTVGQTVLSALSERDPKDVVDLGLGAGMTIVAKLFADQVYRLPEIMMSTKTMEIGIGIAEEKASFSRRVKAEVQLPRSDSAHDIGTKAAEVMIKSSGYGVVEYQTPVAVSSVAESISGLHSTASGALLKTSTMKAFPGRSVR